MSGDDLFPAGETPDDPVVLGDGAVLLPGFAAEEAPALLDALCDVIAAAPLRQMQTPGGYTMSVAMTNCGALGWSSDARGYRYAAADPRSGEAWPQMPGIFAAFARRAAARAGYRDFEPDACLISRYLPGAKLSPHQDRDESDLAHPIVALSLGLPAIFQFGGSSRRDRLRRIALRSGDVVVWGGASRLAYHGVLPLPDGLHPLTGRCRFNLSWRRAG